MDKDTIKAIAQKAGLGESEIRPIGSGLYNDSFYIRSPRGRFVLRIAPDDDEPKLFYEVDMMKSEVNIHRIVREKTEVPAPEIVFYDFSRELIDRDWLVMEYLEGQPGSFDERQLGGLTRQLHNIKGEEYGYPERAAPTGDSWPGIFGEYFQLIFRDCLDCGVINGKEFDYFLSVYERHKGAIKDAEPSLLHLDLWSQNILTRNGRITGVLDFDRGLYGDPELEFAVLDTYGYSGPEFFQGYGRARPADEEARIRQRLYIVYELIKYAFIRTARGGMLSTGTSHVARCRRIISELE